MKTSVVVAKGGLMMLLTMMIRTGEEADNKVGKRLVIVITIPLMLHIGVGNVVGQVVTWQA